MFSLQLGHFQMHQGNAKRKQKRTQVEDRDRGSELWAQLDGFQELEEDRGKSLFKQEARYNSAFSLCLICLCVLLQSYLWQKFLSSLSFLPSSLLSLQERENGACMWADGLRAESIENSYKNKVNFS